MRYASGQIKLCGPPGNRRPFVPLDEIELSSKFMHKTTIKLDDKAQSGRLFETAREIGAAADDSRADELISKLAKQPPEPRKPEKPEN
jgi:hypothetical protein